jgi:ligand-binding SRPBCC domain-containing protein
VKIFELTSEQWLPRPLAEVFDFYANAHNLQLLTPDWLRFEVQALEPIPMSKGAQIDYRLKLHGIPMRWRSEITAWEPPLRFVDFQRRGPYRFWEHEHTFAEQDDGTLVGDRVRYSVPGGALVNWLLVGRDVRRIFECRGHKLTELFGARGQRLVIA